MSQPPDDPKRQQYEKLLKAIRQSQNVSKTPDPKSKEEVADLESERKKAELEGLRQDTSERKTYAFRFFCLACAWVCIITVVALLQGFGSFWWGRMPFKLSDPVLLALIGSTTANVLGIMYVVANYLFPKR